MPTGLVTVPISQSVPVNTNKYNSQPTLVRVYYNQVLAANAQYIFQVGLCDHLFLEASTGNIADLAFSFDDQAQQPLLIGQIVASKTPFKTVQIVNTTNASITYTLVVSYGAIDFKGLVIASAITTLSSQNGTGTYASDVTTGAAASVFTALSNLAIILCADPSNTANIYIGFDNTVSASKKVIALQPGQIYVFNSYKGALWAFSSGAQKLSVSYM